MLNRNETTVASITRVVESFGVVTHVRLGNDAAREGYIVVYTCFWKRGVSMWSNNRTRKTIVIIVCFLVGGLVLFGNFINGHVANAATAIPSHSSSAASINVATTNAAAFRVTSIDMSVTPTTTSTWKCGSSIQVVYNAVFHVVSGRNGGTIVFSYTVNNGRSQMMEKLTILPGQRLSNFVFTWQGSLPSDHTYPGPGGVLVTSPNSLVSHMILPTGRCR